ncbi:MAG: phospho-sugar mutase [Deltaproteobacteria bacterium]|nr:MAG: phospho-sugar mutase [Deltaproteobacteria bacterium]
MTAADRARAWLAQDPDPETRAEIEALLAAGGDALEARFAGRLSFGTAGIRGVLGAGPMRMNRVLIRQVTAGLADYLAATVPGARERGVVVGRDARRKSDVFAEDTARVLRGKGFRVWLAPGPVPTPLVAFAVRHLGAAAGVVVTASHNPPAYNGYKVYWENAAQIVPPHDEGISAAIDAVATTADLALPPLDAEPLGAEVEEAYLAGVRALAIAPDAAARAPLAIAYTPLHGVGARFVEAALARAGFTDVRVEPSQREPDGTFPTVEFPNPEEPGAMDRVLALARDTGADLVLANDPDADRLAVAVPDGDGYRMLTGDQVGVLLADYLLAGTDGDDRLVATTIVSSQLLGDMARAAGVAFCETLTGFKWIANAALQHGGRFVFGYEEALGYCVGELVRDKDGISAAALVAELAAVAKAEGQSLDDRLDAIYRRYGLYLTEQVSIVRAGDRGIDEIRAAMDAFRAAPPERIGDWAVERCVDVARGDGGLPPSDVLIYYIEGGRRVIMRPSGTEPKLKSYYEVREAVAEGEPMAAARRRAQAALAALRDAHQARLRAAFATPG